jgi:hypothetical protein
VESGLEWWRHVGAEQSAAADCLQRPLLRRSRLRQRLSRGVIRHVNGKCRAFPGKKVRGKDMPLQRMDNVLIVVDDLEAAKAFFVELGMELEGEMPLEGRWVDLRWA